MAAFRLVLGPIVFNQCVTIFFRWTKWRASNVYAYPSVEGIACLMRHFGYSNNQTDAWVKQIYRNDKFCSIVLHTITSRAWRVSPYIGCDTYLPINIKTYVHTSEQRQHVAVATSREKFATCWRFWLIFAKAFISSVNYTSQREWKETPHLA